MYYISGRRRATETRARRSRGEGCGRRKNSVRAERIDQERRELKKQREREKKERLKAEGKLLTAKQKAQLARTQASLEILKAQGKIQNFLNV